MWSECIAPEDTTWEWCTCRAWSENLRVRVLKRHECENSGVVSFNNQPHWALPRLQKTCFKRSSKQTMTGQRKKEKNNEARISFFFSMFCQGVILNVQPSQSLEDKTRLSHKNEKRRESSRTTKKLQCIQKKTGGYRRFESSV